MNRIIIIIITFIMLFSCLPYIECNAEENFTNNFAENILYMNSIYDSDSNGEVTVDDALIVLQCIVELIEPNEKYDVNNDGITNVEDAMKILQYVVGFMSDSVDTDKKNYIELNDNPDIETIKYNGLNIKYSDTEYRMDDETINSLTILLNSVSYSKAFVIYDINSNSYISYNADTYYSVASTVKAPFVLTCLYSVDAGEHFLDDTMTYTSSYYSGGSGDIQYTSYGTVYTLRELMDKTITISDNIGYHMLKGRFGYTDYNNFLTSLGNKVTINNYTKWGQTSAIDSARNWTQIYNYVEGANSNSAFFSDILKSTTNSCIRDALGEKYTVANKMGWMYNTCCHDHAIVYAENPYILIIMTNGNAYDNNQKFIQNLAINLDSMHDKWIS